jgi:hypothetical protein
MRSNTARGHAPNGTVSTGPAVLRPVRNATPPTPKRELWAAAMARPTAPVPSVRIAPPTHWLPVSCSTSTDRRT